MSLFPVLHLNDNVLIKALTFLLSPHCVLWDGLCPGLECSDDVVAIAQCRGGGGGVRGGGYNPLHVSCTEYIHHGIVCDNHHTHGP